jgi:hypothetical protein
MAEAGEGVKVRGRLEIRDWRLEIGDWRLGEGDMSYILKIL